MWDLNAYPGKILGIRPTEIEFESDFSSISQYLSTLPFLLLKILRIDPLRLNVRLISAVYHNR